MCNANMWRIARRLCYSRRPVHRDPARRITLDLAGDLTHHLRRPENLPPRAPSPHQG
ncbi:hypothetical protein GCM10010177_24350 [Actinomadura citrea]|nr:hypothetical protein GCM10010177_24350 [Actinomadura citrea]